jgi:hypothetical protein
MRILRKKVSRTTMKVGKIAPAAAGYADFLGGGFCMI